MIMVMESIVKNSIIIKIMIIKDLLIGVAAFFVAHVLTFYQLNGQFLKSTSWFRDNTFWVAAFGIIWSYFYIWGTKYAVRAISEGLRLESSGKIQVTCIYPGAFKTELAFSIKDESMLEALMTRGIGNIAQPAERVAESIIYALQLDPGVSVNEIVIRPTAQEA